MKRVPKNIYDKAEQLVTSKQQLSIYSQSPRSKMPESTNNQVLLR